MSKKKDKIVTLIFEGLPGSGKTSVARVLSRDFGFKKINESKGYLDNSFKRKLQVDIFRETVERYSLINYFGKGKFIIDRGYLSVLAWDYCEDVLYGTGQLAEKQKWINQSFIKNEIFHPTMYVYFKLSPEKSVLRKPRAVSRGDVWSSSNGLNLCSKFFTEEFSKLVNQGVRVLAIDQDLSIENKVKLILKNI